jgi:hypothetical protein
MGWVPSRYLWDLPKPAPAPPARLPAPVAVMADELRDRPYVGSSYSAMLVPRNDPPPPPPPPPFQPPPPNWPEEERLRRERGEQLPEPEPRPGALAELKAQVGEEPPPPPALQGPPVVLEPLRRPEIPAADWRQELREREESERRERAKKERYRKLLELVDEEGT